MTPTPTQSQSQQPTLQQSKQQQQQISNDELSKCILSQYRFCASGVILGASLSVARRGYFLHRMSSASGTSGSSSRLGSNVSSSKSGSGSNNGSGAISPWPMLGGGFSGTLGDFIYGYFVECAHLHNDYKGPNDVAMKDFASKTTPSGIGGNETGN